MILRLTLTNPHSLLVIQVLFAEAPIDSDVFLSYMHHNYTAFTNDIDECLGIVEGMSTADGLMRLEGEDVSLLSETSARALCSFLWPSQWLQRVSLTSQYSFNTAVRSTLLHLPSPVPRRKQVLRKSALWEKLRETRANEEGIEKMYRKKDGIALVPPFEFDVAEEDVGGWRGGGGSQRSRRSLTTELVPYVGVIRKKGTKGGVLWLLMLLQLNADTVLILQALYLSSPSSQPSLPSPLHNTRRSSRAKRLGKRTLMGMRMSMSRRSRKTRR